LSVVLRPEDWIPLVRCRLGGPEEAETVSVRYVPLGEFDLWRHLMETKHRRSVRVETVSVWLSEEAARRNGLTADDLDPVVRLRLELPGPVGVPVSVERFLAAETYHEAREILLSHFGGPRRPRRVLAAAGYFVPPRCVDERLQSQIRGVA
jgi:hypothetical protein